MSGPDRSHGERALAAAGVSRADLDVDAPAFEASVRAGEFALALRMCGDCADLDSADGAELLALAADSAPDQDVGEFLAILSDAASHRYLAGEQFWPDTWQALRDLCVASASVQALLASDPDLSRLTYRLRAFGLRAGYAGWRAGQ